MVTKEQRKNLKKRLEEISADMRDKTIFATRYGLFDGLYKSTEETGRIHGMTGANVRIILTRLNRLL